MTLNSPHFDLSLFKAVRHKIDILKCGDDAFLFACDLGVERHDPCIARESMLWKNGGNIYSSATQCCCWCNLNCHMIPESRTSLLRKQCQTYMFDTIMNKNGHFIVHSRCHYCTFNSLMEDNKPAP